MLNLRLISFLTALVISQLFCCDGYSSEDMCLGDEDFRQKALMLRESNGDSYHYFSQPKMDSRHAHSVDLINGKKPLAFGRGEPLLPFAVLKNRNETQTKTEVLIYRMSVYLGLNNVARCVPVDINGKQRLLEELICFDGAGSDKQIRAYKGSKGDLGTWTLAMGLPKKEAVFPYSLECAFLLVLLTSPADMNWGNIAFQLLNNEIHVKIFDTEKSFHSNVIYNPGIYHLLDSNTPLSEGIMNLVSGWNLDQFENRFKKQLCEVDKHADKTVARLRITKNVLSKTKGCTVYMLTCLLGYLTDLPIGFIPHPHCYPACHDEHYFSADTKWENAHKEIKLRKTMGLLDAYLLFRDDISDDRIMNGLGMSEIEKAYEISISDYLGALKNPGEFDLIAYIKSLQSQGRKHRYSGQDLTLELFLNQLGLVLTV